MPRTVRGRFGGSRIAAAVQELPRRRGTSRRGRALVPTKLKKRIIAGVQPGSIEERLLTEEERIESAKYQPRDQPARLFEEERFLFPESYGLNRLRLLVKDPYWLFAYWDVDLKVVKELRREVGVRVAALSRITLRISDPDNGGATAILLPADARGWYIQADAQRRAYQAELGLTLPSGEFRLLATSNRVSPPQAGPSANRASRRATYRPEAPPRMASTPRATGPGPWQAPPPSEGGPSEAEASRLRTNKGGASDAFRR